MPLMAIALLFAACNKQQPVPAATAAPKTAPKAVLPDVLSRPDVDPNEVFTVRRDGQNVTINILPDFSACKRIYIKRNTTGINNKPALVGDLPPKQRQLNDTLTSSRPYYYWLTVQPHSGRERTFGPIRISPDEALTGTYVSTGAIYPWQLSRTNTRATISWQFPEATYHSISIKRNTSKSMSKRKEIYATREWTGSITDRLPDPNADYWYWIEITTEGRNKISRGPIKAKFSAQ